jgi:hypothetical protein
LSWRKGKKQLAVPDQAAHSSRRACDLALPQGYINARLILSIGIYPSPLKKIEIELSPQGSLTDLTLYCAASEQAEAVIFTALHRDLRAGRH